MSKSSNQQQHFQLAQNMTGFSCTLTVVTLVALSTSMVTALSCYSCDSHGDATCATIPGNDKLIQCPVGDTHCTTSYVMENGTVLTERSCAAACSPASPITFYGKSVETQCCDQDGCNNQEVTNQNTGSLVASHPRQGPVSAATLQCYYCDTLSNNNCDTLSGDEYLVRCLSGTVACGKLVYRGNMDVIERGCAILCEEESVTIPGVGTLELYCCYSDRCNHAIKHGISLIALLSVLYSFMNTIFI